MSTAAILKKLAQGLIVALPYILEWVDEYIKKKQRERREAEREAKRKRRAALARDPGGAFRGHFERVRNGQDRPGAGGADEAE